MPKKAVQQIMLGKVITDERSAKEVLSKVKNAGYDGIELNGFMIHPTSMLVRILTKAAGMPTGNGGKLDWNSLVKESGLCVTSIHTDLGSVERDSNSVAEEVLSFDSKYAVITGMYRFDYSNENEVHKLAERLNKAGENLKAKGVDLLYHNHNCELIKYPSGQNAYDILLEETNPDCVNFEYDSYWFSEAGADILSYMKKLGKRMKMWHINDRGVVVKNNIMTPILKSDSKELGYGNLPLDELYKQALSVDVDSIILESHKNHIDNDPIKSLTLSAEYLKR